MIRVLVESPFASKLEDEHARLDAIHRNVLYARAALHDCFRLGEAPFASHLIYTQPGVLDDNVPAERAQGIEAGLQWGAMAHLTVMYVDRGISNGMRMGLDRAREEKREVRVRVRCFYESRPDGWPLCPVCGEDELWSGALAATPATIEGCYRCRYNPDALERIARGIIEG